jgi:hypothetical protein
VLRESVLPNANMPPDRSQVALLGLPKRSMGLTLRRQRTCDCDIGL